MAWQYMKGGELCGPLSDDEFRELLPGIEPDTKIYRDGWKEWRKLESVPRSELPQPPEAPPLDESSLKQAGFFRRLGAFVLDYVLVALLLHQFSTNSFSQWQDGWSFSTHNLNFDHFWGPHALITLVYETLMVSQYGWTLGKFVFGIQVLHEGKKLSWQRSLLRFAAKKLNWLTLFVGYLMAAWNKDGRALHDHICKTRVYLK